MMGRMARYPSLTPYLGPTACYDKQIDPEQLLRRLAYGRATPMLRPRQRLTTVFFARLLDAMANAHVVLVKITQSESGAYSIARRLRAELPPESFGVTVDFDPAHGDWNVLVFNQVPMEMRVIRPREPDGEVWIGPREVARVLRVTRDHAARIIDRAGVDTRRRGGRNERQIRQRDMAILANRKGRWRRRTRR